MLFLSPYIEVDARREEGSLFKSASDASDTSGRARVD